MACMTLRKELELTGLLNHHLLVFLDLFILFENLSDSGEREIETERDISSLCLKMPIKAWARPG